MSDTPADAAAPLTTANESVPVVADSTAPEDADAVPAAAAKDASSAAGEKTEEAAPAKEEAAAEPAKEEETGTKRPAEEEPEEKTDAKKAKGDDDEEDEDVSGELAHLDSSNIIEGGRRTRGKKVDYSKLENPGDDESDEDDAEVNPDTLPKEGEEGAEGDDDEDDEE
ncbi:hypothetical protein JCM6882_002449 [Rhodosporidiobolus microsporus]